MSAWGLPENPANTGVFADVQVHSFTFGCGVLLVIHWLEFRTPVGDTWIKPSATVRGLPGCTACQYRPHVGLGQAELPGDLRWFNASLEGGPHGVELSRRQMHGGRLDLQLVGRVNRDSRVPAQSDKS